MRCFFKITSVISLILFINNCSEDGTKPPFDNQPDTTSHNFNWQIYEFPTNQFRSNIFWDIQAISNDNVWAVGTIYVDSLDNTGNYIPPYSIAHWDGIKWNLKRITYRPENNVLSTIRAIWYFNDNDIWFASYSLFHFNGNNTYFVHRPDYGGIYHLWAASENEIYGVGNDGLILKYNGANWVIMESGTTMDLQDIWGTVDEKTGAVEVWTGGYDESQKIGIILKYDGNNWIEMFSENSQIYLLDNDHTAPTAVWVFKDSVYFALAGYDSSKIVQHSRTNFLRFVNPYTEDQGSIQSFHGNNYHDYFAVGYRDVVLHYNGKSFKKYFDWIYLDGRYHGVQQIGDEVFICGNKFGWNTALLLHGTRTPN